MTTNSIINFYLMFQKRVFKCESYKMDVTNDDMSASSKVSSNSDAVINIDNDIEQISDKLESDMPNENKGNLFLSSIKVPHDSH